MTWKKSQLVQSELQQAFVRGADKVCRLLATKAKKVFDWPSPLTFLTASCWAL